MLSRKVPLSYVSHLSSSGRGMCKQEIYSLQLKVQVYTAYEMDTKRYLQQQGSFSFSTDGQAFPLTRRPSLFESETVTCESSLH